MSSKGVVKAKYLKKKHTDKVVSLLHFAFTESQFHEVCANELLLYFPYNIVMGPYCLHFHCCNSMEQNPWEANSHSANQEILHLLWNMKVYFCVHKSQMHPVHTIPPYFTNIHSNIILLFTPMSSQWSLHTGFPTKILYVFLLFPMLVTYTHGRDEPALW